MVKISIIVPIFHGRKYVDNMIAQLEQCADKRRDKYTLELVLINDDPGERIGVRRSEKIEIKTVETDKNRGIHGARVRGLAYCTGEYVLFLDQDDKIRPTYFLSQLFHLGEADAVVCKLFHEGRQFYDNRMPFEQVITREFILSVRNSIISPGQVLIRKTKIPVVWKDARLENNGADDWLLWLCMLAEDSKFALNSDILFEHVVEGGNESINTMHMMASEHEIYEVAAAADIFSTEELDRLWGAVQAAAESHIKVLSKFQKMFFIYDQWLRLQEEGKYIHKYLKKCGVRRVAIYGDSYIGKRLYHSLQGDGVEVSYFIDRNAAYLEEKIPVYPLQVGLPSVDLILISLVEGIKEITEELKDITEIRIYSIQELLTETEKAV